MNTCTRVKLSSSTPTLRDQFATAALTGLLSGRYDGKAGGNWVKRAYQYADKMMEERTRNFNKNSVNHLASDVGSTSKEFTYD